MTKAEDKTAPSHQTEAESKEKKWCMGPYAGIDYNLQSKHFFDNTLFLYN